jgi:hypothetical protein
VCFPAWSSYGTLSNVVKWVKTTEHKNGPRGHKHIGVLIATTLIRRYQVGVHPSPPTSAVRGLVGGGSSAEHGSLLGLSRSAR